MNRICCYLCLLLLGVGLPVEAARRSRYSFEWHRFECVNNWSIVKNWSCVIVGNMVLFDSTVDICKLMSGGNVGNKVVTFVFQSMLKDTNLAKQCPISKGLLYFHNMIDLDHFPAFMPEMDFTAYMKFFRPNLTENTEVFLNGSLIEVNRQRQKLWH
ncbi:uncharacterized protein LOC111600775 [Drosophila hydei]|uniref:Uncharacterized protein LOC111600775 n=1 Tax=Drosophila hydei TaxID=7224 RepID=A0A6J1M7H6_DROHY|nr:uncharacterized protein LOC111600775 [Drosophila hydei]